MLPDLPWAVAMCVAGTVLAVRLGGAVLPRGRRPFRRSLRRFASREESGSAVLDFVLTFPLFLMVVLLVIQFVLLVRAQVVVSHATFLAARSAVVWIEEGVEIAERRAQAAAAVGCMMLMPSGSWSDIGSNWGAPVPLDRAPSSLFAPLLAIHGGEKIRRTQAAYLRHLKAKRWTEVSIDLEEREIEATTVVPVEVVHHFQLTVPYADGVLGRLIGERTGGHFVVPIRDTYTLQGQKRVLTPAEPGTECNIFGFSIGQVLRAIF